MPESEAAAPRSRWETAGVVSFCAMAIGIALRLLAEPDPTRQNVWLKVFAPAAQAFVDGGAMYTEESGFRYPPIAAALMVPFTWLGPLGGSILWRWTMLLCLGLAVRACMLAGFPFAMTSRERGVFWLLLTPAVVASANIGQANTAMLGCMLFATLAAWRGRCGAASLGVCCSTAIKIYPLAHGLVLAVLRPRMWPALAVGLSAIAALPLLLQKPAYVIAQYEALVELLRHEDRTGTPANAYRDLRSLAAVLGTPIARDTFLALQAASGAGIACLCWWLQRRRVPPARVMEHAFSLTVCWCLLLGPATERVTYALLGPSIAWPLLHAWRRGGLRTSVGWVTLNALYAADHLVRTSRSYQAAHPATRQLLVVTTLLAAFLMLGRAWREGWRPGAAGGTMPPDGTS